MIFIVKDIIGVRKSERYCKSGRYRRAISTPPRAYGEPKYTVDVVWLNDVGLATVVLGVKAWQWTTVILVKHFSQKWNNLNDNYITIEN